MLHTSGTISSAVVCVRPDVFAEYGHILRDGMSAMHEAPAGLQVLRMFSIDRLVPFEDSHLDPVRALLAAGVDDADHQGAGP